MKRGFPAETVRPMRTKTYLGTVPILPVEMPACSLHRPPPPYNLYEASWFSASLYGAPSILGLRANFWIDNYRYGDYYYTKHDIELYMADGSVDVLEPVNPCPPVNYSTVLPYDIYVYPTVHLMVDSTGMARQRLDWGDGQRTAEFDIALSQRKFWGRDYYSAFGSTITQGLIQDGLVSTQVSGDAAIERWFGRGGYDISKPREGNVGGYWLYEPLWWTDLNDNKIATIVWHHLAEDGSEVPWGGSYILGGIAYDFPKVEVNYNYPENMGSDVVKRYSVTARDATGLVIFSYEVSAGPQRVTQPMGVGNVVHSYVQGWLQMGPQVFNGGGVSEWIASTINPLPP